MELDLKKWIDFWLGNFLLFFLKPLAQFLGKVLRRNHDLTPKGDIAVIKLLGGGSLVIALPALLAIRKKYPESKLILVTTPAIKPFAETLGVFDDFYLLNDQNFFRLVSSSLLTLRRLWRIDCIIDYEVHSRLTTIFSLLTCARNRIGFYVEDVRDRKFLSTHTVFFNLYYGSWYFYEELSRLLGCEIPNAFETRDHFVRYNQLAKSNEQFLKIGIGHGCSNLSPERMLSKEHWLKHFRKHLRPKAQVYFLGGPNEKDLADEIITYVRSHFPDVIFENMCGKHKVKDSIGLLYQMDEFWGIDSALLHYARLLGIKTTAYFGPTMPQSLLKSMPDLEEDIHYKQIYCSPCVHVTETPPCNGDNKCIKNLFND